jgi:RimJ/RimL family protein N-acetyltransferase
MNDSINVRAAQKADIDLIINYWFRLNAADLTKMGADINKLPSKSGFKNDLIRQLELPINQRNVFTVIWELNGKPIGHSNTNPTTFGDSASIHLHLWKNSTQQKGLGTQFLKKTISIYFEKLHLKTLFCEPYALNPAPNKTLPKVGFEFEKEYVTTPGSINFEQSVNRWKMSLAQFEMIFK